ncbi:hypothetical protein WICANDRAFT_61905 [Wickerhamomyces anomalus NRRL Y-366-8]|uniref:Uncharacterized protein n=1 Tax=Wickerhamomyces anomalus (strain ATCC 58044 / CBS 1984 / NCYC 433 / NRRL Y-366-8) TaxID=683960 RepID=A0A1E3P7L3_WICAA|nr:uncharacterized protein WICANDRAFT_61905 [Wickerhamomyces anomalus NRRL Y-366-8]ODQ61348.1 hypothetical protein WICANDRAFT_61905 [Wickerhamomyces anomalus NRRL Y-366-8]
MSSVYARPGASAAPKKSEKESIYSKIVNNPSFPIIFNLGLFAAGIAFIQSPIMDAMAPHLIIGNEISVHNEYKLLMRKYHII